MADDGFLREVVARKWNRVCSPRWTVTWGCSGSKRQGRSGAMLVSKRTTMVSGRVSLRSAPKRWVVPWYPVASQKIR